MHVSRPMVYDRRAPSLFLLCDVIFSYAPDLRCYYFFSMCHTRYKFNTLAIGSQTAFVLPNWWPLLSIMLYNAV